jgi:hypothetical protein
MSQPKLQIGYFFRPSCGSEDRTGPDIGPFPDYFELTYDELRVGPDGGSVAAFYHHGDPHNPLRNLDGQKVSGWSVYEPYGDGKTFWSDLVMYARPLESGEKYLVVRG